MSQNLNSGCATSALIIFSLIGIGLAMLIPYYLCNIDPTIEAGWLRGLWHGSNFIGNFILSLFLEERLLKAPLHTTAYSIFWWIFTVCSFIGMFFSCIKWINQFINMRKMIS
jgi:putative flippase GtrA